MATIPQGWYTDPKDSTRYRYWDGNVWTLNVQETSPLPPFPPPVIPPPLETVPEPASTAVAAFPQPSRQKLGMQKILLGAGGLLVLAAVAAFIAFIWNKIGPYGQAAILTAIALGFGVTAVRIKQLTATRETFSLIALGILLIEFFSAPQFGLLPEDFYTFQAFGQPLALFPLSIAALAAARQWKFLILRYAAWFLYAWAGAALALGFFNQYDDTILYTLNAQAIGVATLGLVGFVTYKFPSVQQGWTPKNVVTVFLGSSLAVLTLVLLTETGQDRYGELTSITGLAFLVSAVASFFIAALAFLLRYSMKLSQAKLVKHVEEFLMVGYFATGIVFLICELPFLMIAVLLPIVMAVGVAYPHYLQGKETTKVHFSLTQGYVFVGVLLVGFMLRMTEVNNNPEPLSLFILFATASLYALILGDRFKSLPLLIIYSVFAFLAFDVVFLPSMLETEIFELYTFSIAAINMILLWELRCNNFMSKRLAVRLIPLLPITAGLLSVFSAADKTAVHQNVTLPLTVTLAAAVAGFAWSYWNKENPFRYISWGVASILATTFLYPISELLPGSPTVEYISLSIMIPFAVAVYIVLQHPWRQTVWLMQFYVTVLVSTVALWLWLLSVESDYIIPQVSTTLMLLGLAVSYYRSYKYPHLVWGYWANSVVLWVTSVCLFLYYDIFEEAKMSFVTAGFFYLIAGILTRVRFPHLPSIIWLAPGLILFSTPYAVEYGFSPSDSWVLFVTVLLSSVLLVIVGVVWKFAGAFIPGIINVTVVGVLQLVNAARILPAWVSLAVAGAVLLAVGVRLEWSRTAVRESTRWIAKLR